jgi:hypothetical protein
MDAAKIWTRPRRTSGLSQNAPIDGGNVAQQELVRSRTGVHILCRGIQNAAVLLDGFLKLETGWSDALYDIDSARVGARDVVGKSKHFTFPFIFPLLSLGAECAGVDRRLEAIRAVPRQAKAVFDANDAPGGLCAAIARADEAGGKGQ